MTHAHATRAPAAPPDLPVFDLGRMPYAEAYAEQLRWHERILAARQQRGHAEDGSGGGGGGGRPAPAPGVILLVEHPPVITITRRASATHLLADPATLAARGIELAHTDRGGDITYHGPGQLVVYPILDLQRLRSADGGGGGLKLSGYMRLLEQVVIDTIAHWGLAGARDPGATGVWVNRDDPTRPPALPQPSPELAPAPAPQPAPALAKIAAMGVRIRRWVTMHGLALNVDPDMSHFQLIVPCGLAGRPVTSMKLLLRDEAPSMDEVKAQLVKSLRARIKAES